MATKQRLDKLIVERELAPSREQAQALVMAGLVRVNGEPARKAGSQIDEDARIDVAGKPHPYVSRGGVKLEAALKFFAIQPAGMTALDIGASTGGFTHCLLTQGAARVYAVDVGYGQLAWEIRQDPRVKVLERTNIRHLPTSALEQPVDLVVIDVSFISRAKVLGEAVRFLAPEGRVLALLKPQFEADREHVRRGGRVTDPAVHEQVLRKAVHAGEALGLELKGTEASPLVGKKSGNREFFVLWAAKPQTPVGA